MPSLSQSREQVKESLGKRDQDDVNHETILAGLQDEIDRHNGFQDDLREAINKNKRSRARDASHHDDGGVESKKFRFKSHRKDDERRLHQNQKRRDRHEGHDSSRKDRRKTDKKRPNHPTPPQDETSQAHPFPREPADPLSPEDLDSTAAFRASLFDALADDEGAAYWESVYSQPIHVYSRPSVPSPTGGGLEQMNDEEYVEYVKSKMWQRKHPEIVQERKKKQREKKLEEEEKTRRREEFVRRKERGAWEKKQGWHGREESEEGYEYVFAGDSNRAVAESGEYAAAWKEYLEKWDVLKRELLAELQNQGKSGMPDSSKRIPWPVLPSKAVIKANIEAFLRHVPAEDPAARMKALKAERVRWHPDKVQQRFGGSVDEGTMKIVTGVFQIVDAVLEEVRKRRPG